MRERTILADCCEDWIVQFGRYYAVGQSFECLECGARWEKLGPGRFRRSSDQRVFTEEARSGEGAHFRYLAAEDGTNPLIERCCAKILLQHGERIKPDGFACPICGAQWKRQQGHKSGVDVVCFVREGLPEPFAIQPGLPRNYLVPLSAYRLPLD